MSAPPDEVGTDAEAVEEGDEDVVDAPPDEPSPVEVSCPFVEPSPVDETSPFEDPSPFDEEGTDVASADDDDDVEVGSKSGSSPPSELEPDLSELDESWPELEPECVWSEEEESLLDELSELLPDELSDEEEPLSEELC